jgi:hypothetical protein
VQVEEQPDAVVLGADLVHEAAQRRVVLAVVGLGGAGLEGALERPIHSDVFAMEACDHDVGRLARSRLQLVRHRTGEVGDVEVARCLKIALRGEPFTLSGAVPFGPLRPVVAAGEQYRQRPAEAIDQQYALV